MRGLLAEVARQLDIPARAFREVAAKDRWTRDKAGTLKCIIRRSQGNWLVLVFRIPALAPGAETRDSDIEQRFVRINDAKEVTYYGEEQPTPK